jgi:hypothetical protein
VHILPFTAQTVRYFSPDLSTGWWAASGELPGGEAIVDLSEVPTLIIRTQCTCTLGFHHRGSLCDQPVGRFRHICKSISRN